jgi:hypothetical protein
MFSQENEPREKLNTSAYSNRLENTLKDSSHKKQRNTKPNQIKPETKNQNNNSTINIKKQITVIIIFHKRETGLFL